MTGNQIRPPLPVRLTPGQLAVMVALVRTGSVTEAAYACGIARGTAQQHIKAVITKYDAASTYQLIHILTKQGLI